MRICAGIVTWQDGQAALENCLASIEAVVDEVVLVDGLIDGIETDLPPNSDWLPAVGPNLRVYRSRWRSQSSQRNVTLNVARNLDCDWLLAIDADEQLCNPEALRPWLEVWKYDAFPLPFYFSDEQQAQPCAFKCLHIPDWQRYACQGSILANSAGELVQVMGQGTWSDPKAAGLPYLVHRPELRPAARQAIRLSEHEVALEPYPPDVKAWLEPVYAPMLLDDPGEMVTSLADAAHSNRPGWYCPGCGRRYGGPGSCEREHERIGLLPLEVAAA